MQRSVSLQRSISSPRCTVSHELVAGTISYLVDAEGEHLPSYLSFLEGKPHPTMMLRNDIQPIGVESVCRVGFNDTFADGATIGDFLGSIGIGTSETSGILARYDLQRVSYLTCNQLPALAQRQLHLIAALRVHTPILILNDPFQPFSGRWREQFAEELLENIQSTGKICCVSQLSFMPTCWHDNSAVRPIDIRADSERAVERAAGIEREEREKKLREERQAAAAAARRASPGATGIPQANEIIPVVQPESYGFRVARDFIFAPLARIGASLRTVSGLVAILCCAVVVGALAFVVVPAIQQKHGTLGTLIAAWSAPEQPPPSADNKTTPEGPAGEEQAAIPEVALAGLHDEPEIELSLEPGNDAEPIDLAFALILLHDVVHGTPIDQFRCGAVEFDNPSALESPDLLDADTLEPIS